MENSQEPLSKNHPLSTVGMLIFSPKKRALFVRSHKWNNLYTVPGGKIQLGESSYDAAIREVQEETDLEVVNVQFALFQECIFSDEFWKRAHLLMHDYIGELKPDFLEEDVKLNNEAEEFIWASAQQVENLPLTREARKLWERAKKLSLS